MRHYYFIDLWFDFFEWLFADKEKRKKWKYLPKYCWDCELLGICRDRDNNWKCHNGCMFINSEKCFNKNKKMK